jgi:hypothetical protein
MRIYQAVPDNLPVLAKQYRASPPPLTAALEETFMTSAVQPPPEHGR